MFLLHSVGRFDYATYYIQKLFRSRAGRTVGRIVPDTVDQKFLPTPKSPPPETIIHEDNMSTMLSDLSNAVGNLPRQFTAIEDNRVSAIT